MRLIPGQGLELAFGTDPLTSQGVPSFVCIRQQHHVFTVTTSLKTGDIQGKGAAGLVLLQNNLYHLKVEVNGTEVALILCENGQDRTLSKKSFEGEEITLGLSIEDLNAKGFFEDAKGRQDFEVTADMRNLSTEVAGGFVGCTAGVYAVGEGGSVCFTKLSYQA